MVTKLVELQDAIAVQVRVTEEHRRAVYLSLCHACNAVHVLTTV